MPGALAKASPRARDTFGHPWAPVQALERRLLCLPQELWAFLLGCEGGWAWIGIEPSRYEPGEASLTGRFVRNVAHVSLEDLAEAGDAPLRAVGHLADHYLGCGGLAEGAWLSEGGGMCPAWREAGERLMRLFPLGYGADTVARRSVRDYFAQSLALYCRDRQGLSVADPQVVRWLRSTLWQEAFWRSQA